MKIKEIFNKPKVIGIVADVNQGKSNFLYHIIKELKNSFEVDIWIYGLKTKQDYVTRINSLGELEQIKNSVIILDEFATLFDLENRKKRKQIENTLRLIHHNNNILVLCGLPENYRKFISAKLDVVIYKKVTIEDLVNGSRVKRIIMDYEGEGKGSCLFKVGVGNALVFTDRYDMIKIPYLEDFDSKKKNIGIIRSKTKSEPSTAISYV